VVGNGGSFGDEVGDVVPGAGEVDATAGGVAGSGVDTGAVAGGISGVFTPGAVAGSLDATELPAGFVSFGECVAKKTINPITTSAATPAPTSSGSFALTGLAALTSCNGCPHSGQMKLPGTEIGWLR
jgi:hypothetical protein